MKLGIVRPCTADSFVVYPEPIYDLPLKECARVLKRHGFTVRQEGAMVVVLQKDVSFTLYRTGRLLVLPCRTGEEAVKRAKEIFGILESDPAISRAIDSAEIV
jgi:hypothetical protein